MNSGSFANQVGDEFLMQELLQRLPLSSAAASSPSAASAAMMAAASTATAEAPKEVSNCKSGSSTASSSVMRNQNTAVVVSEISKVSVQRHQVEIHHLEHEDASDLDEAEEELKPIVRRNHNSQQEKRVTKMERGISRVTDNEILVNKARCQVEQDFIKDGSNPGSPDSPHKTYRQLIGDCIETPVYTFTLPDITRYPEDFREFLKKDLIEVSSLIQLEQSGRLNWWAETGTCQRLWPIATTGDGNCLLHAASLAMWGFHDRLLTLRKALHSLMTSGDIWPAIYRRWRLTSHLYNTQFGLILDETEWQEEWKSVLKLASSEPRHPSNASSNGSSGGTYSERRRSRFSIVALPKDLDSQGESSSASSTASTGSSSSGASSMMYESLEEIHVLALAHVLRRPIIVVADTILRDMNGDALAPIPFGGIYLPLEIPSEECHKSPLLLTYNAGHFSALVTMQDHGQPDYYDSSQLPAVIPVTDAEHTLLNVHFSVDPGPDFVWGRDEYDPNVMSSLMSLGEPAEHLNSLASYLDLVKVSLPEWVLDQANHYHNHHHHHHHHHHKKKVGASMAKQFGSLGKKFRKNLAKITQTVSNGHYRPANSSHGKDQNGHASSVKIVSNSQNFILGAVIHNKECAPYQNEMIDNYLVDARQRFDLEQDLKAKQKQEQIEQHEKMKRDIYLNGGYVDCVNPGCVDQGTAETSYLCKSCYQQQTNRTSQKSKSKFYIVPPPPPPPPPPAPPSNQDYHHQSYATSNAPPASPRPQVRNSPNPPSAVAATMEVDCGHIVPVYVHHQNKQLTSHNHQAKTVSVPAAPATVGHIVPVAAYTNPMRVKLPPTTTSSAAISLGSNNFVAVSNSSHPCKNSSCEFYGTPELDYFCSKCSKKAR